MLARLRSLYSLDPRSRDLRLLDMRSLVTLSLDRHMRSIDMRSLGMQMRSLVCARSTCASSTCARSPALARQALALVDTLVPDHASKRLLSAQLVGRAASRRLARGGTSACVRATCSCAPLRSGCVPLPLDNIAAQDMAVISLHVSCHV